MSNNPEPENSVFEQPNPSTPVKSETHTPVTPEVSEYEARSSRLKNLLLSSSKRTKQKVKKKIDPNKLKHAKFQREVEAGLYQPTDEETNQIVLVPHFENVKFYKFQKVESKKEEKKLDVTRKKSSFRLTEEQYNQIQEEMAKEAEKIYEQNLPKQFQKKFAPKTQKQKQPDLSLQTPQDDFLARNNSCDLLRKAITKLDNEIKMIENQDTVLAAHLTLLDKAKQRLELTVQCSIEAIQWEKQKIEEFYQTHPDVPRIKPK